MQDIGKIYGVDMRSISRMQTKIKNLKRKAQRCRKQIRELQAMETDYKIEIEQIREDIKTISIN